MSFRTSLYDFSVAYCLYVVEFDDIYSHSFRAGNYMGMTVSLFAIHAGKAGVIKPHNDFVF